MSIDYDKLRELLGGATPGPWEQATRGQIGNRELRMIVALVGGDESGEEIGDSSLEADRELVALAPDMARELLRLRDELADLRDEYARIYTVCNSSNDPVGNALAGYHLSLSNRLNRILQGDTE